MKRNRFEHPSVHAALGMFLEGVEDESWMRGTQATKIMRLSGGGYHLGIDLDSLECERIIGVLEQDGRVPRSSFNVYFSEDWWKDPDPIWVAAEFMSDNWVNVSPENAFDPVCPPPCFGLVPIHLPLHVLNQPKGIVVHLKNDILFSEQIAAFLAKLASCQFGEVYLDNKPLRSHLRLFPQEFRKVLATDLMMRVNCTACDSPIVNFWGASVGRLIDDLVVCRNEDGVGHMGAEQPVLISVEVAAELKKRFPKGFALHPILDINSSLGQRISQLFPRLQALQVFRDSGKEAEVSKHLRQSSTRLNVESDDDIPL